MSGIYHGNLLDHAMNPRNRGILDPADFSFQDAGSVCGDEVRIDVRVTDNHISAVAFSGRGCAVSQASASILTELILHMAIDDAKTLTDDDLLTAIGVPLGPARLECALLSLTVLRAVVAAPVP
jgi:nitrogen fixation NifU-like protein